MGSLTPLQGIFLTQGANPGLLHLRQILDHLSLQGRPQRFLDLPNLGSMVFQLLKLYVLGGEV